MYSHFLRVDSEINEPWLETTHFWSFLRSPLRKWLCFMLYFLNPGGIFTMLASIVFLNKKNAVCGIGIPVTAEAQVLPLAGCTQTTASMPCCSSSFALTWLGTFFTCHCTAKLSKREPPIRPDSECRPPVEKRYPLHGQESSSTADYQQARWSFVFTGVSSHVQNLLL